MKPIEIFPLNKVLTIRLSGNKVILPESTQNEVDIHWQRLLGNNPKLFNGEVFTVSDLNIDESSINVELDETNYAHYLYDIRPKGPGPSGVRLIHSSVVTITSDNKVLIGSMNDHTKLPGNIQFCGGGLDHDDVEDVEVNINHNTIKELGEELGINVTDSKIIKSFKPSYIKFGGNTNTIVVYYILRLKISSEEFFNNYNKFLKLLAFNKDLPEFKHIYKIDFNNSSLDEFIKRHTDHLEESVPELLRFLGT